MGLIAALFICIPIILTTTTFKLFKRWLEDNKRISELKTGFDHRACFLKKIRFSHIFYSTC
jgi:hypothetical protein